MKQTCLSLLLGLSLTYYVSAQTTPGGVSGHTLWLEAGSFNPSLPVGEDKDKDLLNSYYNYNPMLNLKQADKTAFRGVIKERFSLFVVFKSDSEEELPVLTINHGRGTTYLTNKELLGDNEFLYKKADPGKGIMISYFSGDRSKWKRRNSLELEDFYGDDKEGKQQLMEVICFDRILSSLERSKVETYLSLKYGISLVGDGSYISSARDTIWDSKKNIIYGKRITGIGRDDAFSLNQKQSGNSEKDGLYIGFGIIDTTNAKNSYAVQDKTFLLWGDNGGSASLKRDEEHNNRQLMKRTWKMQPYQKQLQDTIFTQVQFNKHQMAYLPEEGENKDEFFWLVVNRNDNEEFDYVNAQYYKQNTEDDNTISFNDVVWDSDKSGSDLFTFIKGPGFFLEYEPEISCMSAQGILKLKIVGGQAPYEIVLRSGTVNEKISVLSETYDYTGLPSGTYELIVTDAANTTVKETVVLDPSINIAASLSPVWELKGGAVVVVPEVAQDDEQLTYQWRKGTEILSTAKEFMASQSGEYSLFLSGSEGCVKELPFTVKEPGTFSGWKLYPNPVKASEPFTIDFNLDKESRVTVKIHSMDGKLISESDLGQIKQSGYRGTLTVSGVYLVTVTINDVPETVSLIIK
jgi:hypothetical protein